MATISRSATIAERVRRALARLTPSQRHIADYVLAHPLKAAALPIDQLADALGVSVATANRFARALEFDGYAQFRAELVLGFEAAIAPVDKLRSQLEQPATVAGVFDATLAQCQRNIEQIRRALDTRTGERAVAAILKARRIGIIGFGMSSWMGGLLQRGLDAYCDDVQLLSSVEGASYAARILTRLRHGDLLIAIAFPRYIADTVRLTRRAHENGLPVLVVTDRVTSPLAPLGTVTLYAPADTAYAGSSETSGVALIEALCSAVAHSAKGSVEAAAEISESMLPWLAGDEGGRESVRAKSGPSSRRAAPARRAKQSKKLQ
jgi:DNA-binding MurR/RpiR family transcriptional regulator